MAFELVQWVKVYQVFQVVMAAKVFQNVICDEF